MRLSSLVPKPALRAVDSARTRRFLGTTGPATEEYVRREGLEVRRGPFAGMTYMAGLERTSGDLVAKLVGSYEHELHPVIDEWIEARPAHVVDIGSAEGYYAVGLARAIPGTTVHAFDIDAAARDRCADLARINGVQDRVGIGGECRPEGLGELPADGVVLLSDCEGAERELLDPQRAPRLLGWRILVELHDFIDPSLTEIVTGRFRTTHDIELIEGRPRSGEGFPELSFMSASQRSAVLSERRPKAMRWADMRPR